jgi:hypothetical protein
MKRPRIYKVADKKYSSDLGWFFICWDNKIYRFVIEFGRLAIAIEAK